MRDSEKLDYLLGLNKGLRIALDALEKRIDESLNGEWWCINCQRLLRHSHDCENSIKRTGRMKAYQPEYDYELWNEREYEARFFYRKRENCLRDFGNAIEIDLSEKDAERVVWMD